MNECVDLSQVYRLVLIDLIVARLAQDAIWSKLKVRNQHEQRSRSQSDAVSEDGHSHISHSEDDIKKLQSKSEQRGLPCPWDVISSVRVVCKWRDEIVCQDEKERR